MNNGFIKNYSVLEEKLSNKDYLDISSSVSTLSEKLSSPEGNSMIGIIGPFGVGKSTLITNTKDMRTSLNEEWIHFDAWQFPERKELWEGLVLETARHLSRLKDIIKEIDGQSNKDKKLAINTAGSVLDVATTAITGFPLLIKSLFSLIKNLEYFAEHSPARRVFEIQDIFASLINTVDKDKVVFVLEDVDRSGEAGLFFLETFRQFLSNTKLDKKVIVIVAISNTNYFANLDTYLKCLDYVEFFNKKESTDLSAFVKDTFLSDVEFETEILIDFIKYIYNKYPDMNLRKIKLILRQANLNYMELCRLKFEPNRLVCIAVTASKYIIDNAKAKTSFFDKFISARSIELGNEINRMILVTNKSYIQYSGEFIVERDNMNKEQLGYTETIYLYKRNIPEDTKSRPSTPFHGEWKGDNTNKLHLPDFYFHDL